MLLLNFWFQFEISGSIVSAITAGTSTSLVKSGLPGAPKVIRISRPGIGGQLGKHPIIVRPGQAPVRKPLTNVRYPYGPIVKIGPNGQQQVIRQLGPRNRFPIVKRVEGPRLPTAQAVLMKKEEGRGKEKGEELHSESEEESADSEETIEKQNRAKKAEELAKNSLDDREDESMDEDKKDDGNAAKDSSFEVERDEEGQETQDFTRSKMDESGFSLGRANMGLMGQNTQKIQIERDGGIVTVTASTLKDGVNDKLDKNPVIGDRESTKVSEEAVKPNFSYTPSFQSSVTREQSLKSFHERESSFSSGMNIDMDVTPNVDSPAKSQTSQSGSSIARSIASSQPDPWSIPVNLPPSTTATLPPTTSYSPFPSAMNSQFPHSPHSVTGSNSQFPHSPHSVASGPYSSQQLSQAQDGKAAQKSKSKKKKDDAEEGDKASKKQSKSRKKKGEQIVEDSRALPGSASQTGGNMFGEGAMVSRNEMTKSYEQAKDSGSAFSSPSSYQSTSRMGSQYYPPGMPDAPYNMPPWMPNLQPSWNQSHTQSVNETASNVNKPHSSSAGAFPSYPQEPSSQQHRPDLPSATPQGSAFSTPSFLEDLAGSPKSSLSNFPSRMDTSPAPNTLHAPAADSPQMPSSKKKRSHKKKAPTEPALGSEHTQRPSAPEGLPMLGSSSKTHLSGSHATNPVSQASLRSRDHQSHTKLEQGHMPSNLSSFSSGPFSTDPSFFPGSGTRGSGGMNSSSSSAIQDSSSTSHQPRKDLDFTSQDSSGKSSSRGKSSSHANPALSGSGLEAPGRPPQSSHPPAASRDRTQSSGVSATFDNLSMDLGDASLGSGLDFSSSLDLPPPPSGFPYSNPPDSFPTFSSASSLSSTMSRNLPSSGGSLGLPPPPEYPGSSFTGSSSMPQYGYLGTSGSSGSGSSGSGAWSGHQGQSHGSGSKDQGPAEPQPLRPSLPLTDTSHGMGSIGYPPPPNPYPYGFPSGPGYYPPPYYPSDPYSSQNFPSHTSISQTASDATTTTSSSSLSTGPFYSPFSNSPSPYMPYSSMLPPFPSGGQYN